MFARSVKRATSELARALNVHVVMHESFEAPAAYEAWAKARGHVLSYTRLYDGESLPRDTGSIDFLLVMGGPQSPATTTDECPHFDAAAEVALIADALERGRIVVGVCLGAQLIGEAYGASFEHSPHREIGVFPIRLTHEALKDPIFSQFPEEFLVGHWHGDMPGLTAESVVLATSEGCPRQVVRYDRGVYGFQCHFEFTPDAIRGMIENCGHELDVAGSSPYIQDAETLLDQDYDAFNDKLFTVLDILAEEIYPEKKQLGQQELSCEEK